MEEYAVAQPKKGNPVLIIVIILAIIATAVAVYFLFFNKHDDGKNSCYEPLLSTGSQVGKDQEYYCLQRNSKKDGKCPQGQLDQSNCNLSKGTYTTVVLKK